MGGITKARGSQSQYPSGTVTFIHQTIAMAFAFTIALRFHAARSMAACNRTKMGGEVYLRIKGVL